jgi:hypothetical protein
MNITRLCIGSFVALAGIAQAKEKYSSQTASGVPCSEIFERGIDKQENLRATLIRVQCGLDAPGAAGPEGVGVDSVDDFTNIDVITGTETVPHTHSESMVWSTPDGQTVVVNYNDSNTAPSNYSGVSVSLDSGQTFTRILPAPFATGHGTNFGDPIVVYNNALGKFFAGDLATGCGGQGVGLWSSPDGMNWSVGACAHIGSSDDRESMWVDNNAGSPFFGRMYVSLNDFARGQNIFVTHSDDGTTWSAPVQVTTGTFIRNIQLTGSPDDGGTVFIFGMDEGGGGINNRINWAYRSLDGGQTWTAVQMGSPFAPPGQALCGYFAAIPSSPGPVWRHMGWGQPAVGPGGVVHYDYAGRGTNPGDMGDIFYTRSDDNGTTWTAPIRLNSDAEAGGNHAQWMPSLSVTPEGNVVASWYDRRNTDDSTAYEFWMIQSSDNGQSWGSDQPISEMISPQPEQPDPTVQSCYAGDYNYHTAITSNSWVTWTDGRVQVGGHHRQDVFFAAVPQIITGGTLQGTVTDTSGAPVAGARVDAVGPVTRRATTNRDGIYRFVGLSEGTYDMTVTAPDYNPATATGVAVVEGQTTTQDFVLSGVGTIEGTVMSSANDPIAGAQVQVMGPVTRTTMTDNNGFYRFRLPVGAYDMTVTVFAYNPGSASGVMVIDGQTTTQNFTLIPAPSHSVSGTVTNSITGTPIQGASVRILNTPIPPATTDANGMYLFPSVPEGTYDIQATAAGFLSMTRPGVVVDHDVVVDFALESSALCDRVPGNLVRNCGFETGDFTGWTRSGDPSATSIDSGSAHSGTYGLDIGPVTDLGFIAQNLATAPGGSYSLCYWLLNLGATPNRFQVSWDHVVIRDDTNLGAFGYTQTCHDVVATSDTTEVKFGFLQVPSYFHFDDVSAAPE